TSVPSEDGDPARDGPFAHLEPEEVDARTRARGPFPAHAVTSGLERSIEQLRDASTLDVEQPQTRSTRIRSHELDRQRARARSSSCSGAAPLRPSPGVVASIVEAEVVDAIAEARPSM